MGGSIFPYANLGLLFVGQKKSTSFNIFPFAFNQTCWCKWRCLL